MYSALHVSVPPPVVTDDDELVDVPVDVALFELVDAPAPALPELEEVSSIEQPHAAPSPVARVRMQTMRSEPICAAA